MTKLTTVHRVVFTYQTDNRDWIPEKGDNPHSRCSEKKEYLTDRDSWSLTIEEILLYYDDKRNKLSNEADTFPCLHSDGFCKPTVKHPYTIVWFPEEICLVFHVSNFIGRMSKINDRYYIETDDFFNTIGLNTEKTNQRIKPTPSPHFKSTLSAEKLSLSIVEIFQNRQTFCKTPTPMFTTHYPDLYNIYQKRFNMQTRNRNLIIIPEQDEQISQESMTSSLVFNTLLNRYSFPPLNNSNSFDVVDYDDHVSTKIDFSINHVFTDPLPTLKINL